MKGHCCCLLLLCAAAAAAQAPSSNPATPTAKTLPEELLAADVPDALAVVRLVRHLGQRDATWREAAIRRLLPCPELAARPVAEAFIKGPLQTRLATLELLQAWHAPVKDLDPWRPETLTEARLKELRAWKVAEKSKRAPLGTSELAAARADIGRMLKGSRAEAAAVRERLARFGPALLPEVYLHLKRPTTDETRERLTALRYRLVAADALVLTWPGGVERLAATSAAVCQKAVQELAARATTAEEPLLLELFAHPDPLVRELSLRSLQASAGPRATEALTHLLGDPDPNVRAAVLKVFAEQPSPGMSTRIIAYVRGEKDADLVVHAVRALAGNQSPRVIDCLKDVLAHKSWRVRAEAADALGKNVGRHTSGNEEKVADVCAAMIGLLEDTDAFVVSRAIDVLARADLAVAVEPLAKVVSRHPELASTAVKALAEGGRMRTKAVAHLRKFCGHDDPTVRAAAVAGVVQVAPEDTDKELRQALKDSSATVRKAAAAVLFQSYVPARMALLLKVQNYVDNDETWEAMARLAGVKDAVDHDLVRKQFASSKKRPAWLVEYAPLLQPLLSAVDPEERLKGALALSSLFEEDRAVPVLLATARTQPDLTVKAAVGLKYLSWPRRLEVFQALLALRPADDDFAGIVSHMHEARDKRAVAVFWSLAGRDGMNDERAASILSGLLRLYFGDKLYQYHNDRLAISEAEKKSAVADARPRAESGSEWQRLIALGVLVTAGPEAALDIGRKLMNDAKISPASRRDAFQVTLLLEAPAARTAAALAGLSHSEPALRKLAAAVLACGTEQFVALRDGKIQLNFTDQSLQRARYSSEAKIIVPEAPRGLKKEALSGLLRDPDPEMAAHAGYLLVLLDEPTGLGPLLRYWRSKHTESCRRLLYRAIAVLNDDAKVSLLEEIYRSFRREYPYEVRDFYWTIRSMEGPNALRLRKQIRKEIGMDNLR
jgi:HEAT repeat protein